MASSSTTNSMPIPTPTTTPLPAAWHHTQQPSLIGVTVLLLVLTNAAIFLKVFWRLKAQKALFADDWCLLASLFLSDGLLSINFVAIKAGLGLHATRVLAQDPSPPNKFIIQAKVEWTSSILIPLTLFLVKLAILLFLRRVVLSSRHRSSSTRSTSTSSSGARSEKKSLRSWQSGQSLTAKDSLQEPGRSFFVAWWLNLAFAICMVIATTIIFICQVRPVDFYWNQLFFLLDIPSSTPHPAHVYVVKYPYAGTGIPEVINEFFIAFLAMSVCYALRAKISSVRMLALSPLFVLGLFVCCCGISRIVYSYDARPDNDFSWNMASVVVWACAQVAVAQIIACLPTMVIDFEILHFDHKDYLTKLWPPHPIHVHVPDVFHFHSRPSSRPSSRPASRVVDGDHQPSTQQRAPSRWSRMSIAAAMRGNRKKEARNPSLESDFEWVTPPRRGTVVPSIHSSAGSDESFRNVETIEANNYGFRRDRDNFFDDSTTTGNSSTAPNSRNTSLGSTGVGDAMPPAYAIPDYSFHQHYDYPEML